MLENSDDFGYSESLFDESIEQEISEDEKREKAETTEDAAKADANPAAAAENDLLREIKSNLDRLTDRVAQIEDSSARAAGEIREIHKLYHNEFANRLQSMQEDLERYREIEKGRIFDSILTELAKLYSDNASIPDEAADEKIKKRLRYMFLDMIQILENNGVMMQKSKPGDKRNAKYCQVVERIPTENPKLHDTVASSRNTGFYVENRPFIKEMVDVYLYSEKAGSSRQAADELQINKEEN